jgi:hypothetical protein
MGLFTRLAPTPLHYLEVQPTLLVQKWTNSSEKNATNVLIQAKSQFYTNKDNNTGDFPGKWICSRQNIRRTFS